VTTSATPPSVAQVKAGQNNGGTAAVDSGNQAVSATGAQNATADGLTASTAYYSYFVHTDAAGNNSTVAAADGFTTDASGYTFTNSEAETWVNARTDSPDDTHKGDIDDLVGALKACGAWTADRLYIPIAGNDTSARLNVVSPATGALTGTATFTSGQGLTGDGTNVLGTGLNANAGTNFGATSFTMFVWVVDATTPVGSIIGKATGNELAINPRGSGGTATCRANTTDTQSPTVADGEGFYALTRTSGTVKVHKNGSLLLTDSSITNSAPGAVELVVLGANSGSTTARIMAAGFCQYLNDTQVGDLYTALNNYKTARSVV
jgi:hypothetical protein